MSFSLVIPALNEYENLKIILPRIAHLTDDIIVVDGDSKDETLQLCKQHNVSHIVQFKKGKGAALIEGIACSKYDIICFIDADLAHNPAQIQELVKPIIKGDFLHVSGSRMLGGSTELFSDFNHIIRLLGSLIINYTISIKFNYQMTDCQNGFRAVHKSLLKKISLTSIHTTFEQELVSKTLALGYPILEIPTHEYARISGKSKINIFKHSPSYILSLLRIICMKKIRFEKSAVTKLKSSYSYKWWEA